MAQKSGAQIEASIKAILSFNMQNVLAGIQASEKQTISQTPPTPLTTKQMANVTAQITRFLELCAQFFASQSTESVVREYCECRYDAARRLVCNNEKQQTLEICFSKLSEAQGHIIRFLERVEKTANQKARPAWSANRAWAIKEIARLRGWIGGRWGLNIWRQAG